VAGLTKLFKQKTVSETNSTSQRKRKNSTKDLTQDLRDASSLRGRVAVNKPFLRNENREKRLRYAK